ncbi:M61 family metallopeptidase [Sulfobacillus thermosulfidooxidans]|nr:PDZ domain-containing protein [Sulfobacillus thermosulfidooxidans]
MSMPMPQTHRFHVRIEWTGTTPPNMKWALPVWTPGSYLIREFSRHIDRVHASSQSQELAVRKLDKATWVLEDLGSISTVILEYDVFAYELSVRTSYLDNQRGYFNGANVFLYPDTDVAYDIELEVIPPYSHWDVATGLTRLNQPGYHYAVPDYDTLVDSPVECGVFQRHSFMVDNVEHELIFTGFDEIDLHALLRDLPPIIQSAKDIFGTPLPYNRYVFLVYGSIESGGGLEHKNSASIIFDRFMLHDPSKYPRVLALFAHEYFHLWNVKRLHPTNLGPFDYQHEVYTSLLWVLEGWTDYYAWLLLVRAGVVDVFTVLDHFAESLRLLDLLPGRHVQSLVEASQDTWIKFYRPDGNTPNITISYYHKGALVALALDLALRQATGGRDSLDTVLRFLWMTYGDQGYPDSAVDEALVRVGGPLMRQRLQQWVYGTDDLPDELFNVVGLKLLKEFKDAHQKVPFTGIITEKSATDTVIIKHVLKDSPAEKAGLAPGDEWIALNGYRIRHDNLPGRLAQCAANTSIQVSVFRQHQLQTYSLTLDPPRPDAWRFITDPNASEEARQQFSQWLGAPYP